MKKKTKILLTVCVVILALIGGTAVWQWQNIKAVTGAVRYTNTEIATQIDEQKEKVANELKDNGIDTIRDFTFEEEEQIRKGEVTLEEAVAKLTLKIEESSNVQESNKGEGSNKEEVTDEILDKTNESKVLITDAVNKMYILKAEYIGKLGEVERAARSDYAVLPEDERNIGGIKKIISKYMATGLGIQSQCDKEVGNILSDLKDQLQMMGESTDVVKNMEKAYEEEKTLKAAYYLSLVQ